jgi:hypothetical protein
MINNATIDLIIRLKTRNILMNETKNVNWTVRDATWSVTSSIISNTLSVALKSEVDKLN